MIAARFRDVCSNRLDQMLTGRDVTADAADICFDE
jgi:hypothetical protein